jgi:hypothetical protein
MTTSDGSSPHSIASEQGGARGGTVITFGSHSWDRTWAGGYDSATASAYGYGYGHDYGYGYRFRDYGYMTAAYGYGYGGVRQTSPAEGSAAFRATKPDAMNAMNAEVPVNLNLADTTSVNQASISASATAHIDVAALPASSITADSEGSSSSSTSLLFEKSSIYGVIELAERLIQRLSRLPWLPVW